jgi:hypothetical protein
LFSAPHTEQVVEREDKSPVGTLQPKDVSAAYEMKQISADFHLISRLSGSHINRRSCKSH